MNIAKLYGMQKVLDERIIKEKGLEGRDLLPNTVLALQVEIAELANEWRGFKHWSNNKEPRTQSKAPCHACRGEGGFRHGDGTGYGETCGYCEGTGLQENRNPLLEEYVDCLHFFLSIARQLDFQDDELKLVDEKLKGETTKNFTELLTHVGEIILLKDILDVRKLYLLATFSMFLCLGKERLGFTPEQVYQGYLDKNKVNHERQENGY